MLTASTGPTQYVATFDYDSVGRLIHRADAAGTTTYTWTQRNELETVTDPLTGALLDYTWDATGRLDNVTTHASTRSYTYDPLGRLATDTLEASGQQTAATSYGYDADGHVTSKALDVPTNSATGTHTYAYDAAGRLVTWGAPDGTSTTFAWDPAGNRTRVGGEDAAYDERNRLLTTGGTGYIWSPSGSLLSTTDSTGTTHMYTSDAFGRTTLAKTTSYTYDDLDRVATEGVTQFGYAATEIDPVAVGVTTVSRLPDGALLSTRTGTTDAQLVGSDIHADATLTYTPDGMVTSTRVFDPFGEPLATTGDTPAFGYQGDYTNSNGEVWMGARWYQPTTATFTSRDTVFGYLATPISLNRYTYAWANPIGMIDHDGHDPCGGDCHQNPIAEIRRQLNNPTRTTSISVPRALFVVQPEQRHQPSTWKSVAKLAVAFVPGSDCATAAYDYHKSGTGPSLGTGVGCALDVVPAGKLLKVASKGVDGFRAGRRADNVVDSARAIEVLSDEARVTANTLELFEAEADIVKAADSLHDVKQIATAVAPRLDDAADLQRRTNNSAATTKSADRCLANSFIPSTLVLMADGSSKPIEDINVGDMVYANDPETGEHGPRRVTALIQGAGLKELVEITINGEIITATAGHPFWLDDERRWVDASDLEPGDDLLLADGTTTEVERVRERTETRTVHNLTVDEIHTYHVLAGTAPVLVHNTNGDCRDATNTSRLVPGGGLAGHEALGGHTLARHVGLSDADLAARLASQPGVPAASTFGSRSVAESSIAATLDANAAGVQSWLAAGGGNAGSAFTHTFGSPVGTSLVRGATGSAPASTVRVVLRPDASMPGGFRILTAFPEL